MDRKRMDFLVHHLGEAIIHQPVPGQPGKALEAPADDPDAVVAAAGCRACVADVLGRFILDPAVKRREAMLQVFFNARGPLIRRSRHSASPAPGSLTCLDRNRVCATMKASIRPITPNTLK